LLCESYCLLQGSCITAAVCSFVFPFAAQEKKISGIIKDESGPAGATVSIKNFSIYVDALGLN
jgi:hypothetical protein